MPEKLEVKTCMLCGSTEKLTELTIRVILCPKDLQRVKSNPLFLYDLKDKIEISQIELAQERI